MLYAYIKKMDQAYVKNVDEEIRERSRRIFENWKGLLETHFQQNFSSGRKSFRTGYAQEAFGEYYPAEIYPVSKLLDEKTAALDDLWDNKNAELTERRINLMKILLSEMKFLEYPEWIREEIMEHYKKLFLVAVSECITTDLIKNSESKAEAINYGIINYFERAKDMDAFVRLPSRALELEKEDIDKITTCGRAFRAKNLCEKDIKDIEHDKKHETSTPITLFLEKKFDVESLVETVKEKSLEEIEKVKDSAENEIVAHVSSGFYKMVKRRSKN